MIIYFTSKHVIEIYILEVTFSSYIINRQEPFLFFNKITNKYRGSYPSKAMMILRACFHGNGDLSTEIIPIQNKKGPLYL